MCLSPALLHCLPLRHQGAGECPLLTYIFHRFLSIFAQSVVIIMCGTPADINRDLGTETVDKDIIIILIDLFK